MRVAITGRAGSGKSTLARSLETLYGFERISLADEVRRIAKKLGYSVQKPYTKKVREILQVIGMTGREIDKDYWVGKLLEEIEGKEKVVVDDVRFLNEVEIFRQHGFLIVKIVVPESTRLARLDEDYVPKNHPSEREIDLIEPDIVLSGEEAPEDNAKRIYELLVEKV